MTAAQQKSRERFKKAIAEAKKIRKKNPKLSQAQAVKQAWAILYSSGKVSGVKKKYDTPYSFKTKKPPFKPIQEWVKKRRFQFRDKKSGKFMSYNSTAFLVVQGIFNNGIKPSLFFTKPFQSAFNKMQDELVEAYGLDVEEFLKYTLKK